MTAPWVIVASGIHRRGGMDRANLALAKELVERGRRVHLVSHHVDEDLASHPLVEVHPVPLPAGSFLLGEVWLARAGRKVARETVRKSPGTRVVVNGGNCDWPDLNWVHAVHHAWAVVDEGTPLWFRAKNRWLKLRARRTEKRALARAALVIANSEQTRGHLVQLLGIEPARIRVVYLGSETDAGEPDQEERRRARTALKVPSDRRLAAFVGALGHDRNKGIDTIVAAWKELSKRPDWNVDLAVAGSGRGLEGWRRIVADAGLQERIRFLGFSERIPELLAAADLLVSPSRYNAYGLNVQEALVRGVPAMVSSRAGISERFPDDLMDMILVDPDDPAELSRKLLAWHREPERHAATFRQLGKEIGEQTWKRMAGQIVALAEEHPPVHCAT